MKYKERIKDPMFWRIVGIVSLVGGAIVFYILGTTPLPSPPEILPPKSLEFTIYLLSTSWLISSTGVKIGLILNKSWMKLSIFSCICFVFLLINMGLMQAVLVKEAPIPEPQPNSLYPYNLVAWWSVSWFWIDLLVIITSWMKKRWLRNTSS